MKTMLALVMLFTVEHVRADIDWKQNPYDKATHIAIGGALSCAVTHWTENPFLGFLAATVVGLVKESAIDMNFSSADAASWAVGGAVGMICIQF